MNKKTFYPPLALYEQEIQKAIQEGALDNLKGKGKPLDLDKYRDVPEEFRIVLEMLEKGDYLPPEIELMKQAEKVRDRLKSDDLAIGEIEALRKKLAALDTEINVMLEKYRR